MREEKLSVTDLFDHELIHAIVQMNGEAIAGGTSNNMYQRPDGSYGKETISKEDAATLGKIPRPSAKGIKYTTENVLRVEQHKSVRTNYFEYPK